MDWNGRRDLQCFPWSESPAFLNSGDIPAAVPKAGPGYPKSQLCPRAGLMLSPATARASNINLFHRNGFNSRALVGGEGRSCSPELWARTGKVGAVGKHGKSSGKAGKGPPRPPQSLPAPLPERSQPRAPPRPLCPRCSSRSPE